MNTNLTEEEKELQKAQIEVLVQQLKSICIAEGGSMFMGWPERWYEAYLRRCTNGHVSRMVLKSEAMGRDACLADSCLAPVALTFPEDKDGPLVTPALPAHRIEAAQGQDGLWQARCSVCNSSGPKGRLHGEAVMLLADTKPLHFGKAHRRAIDAVGGCQSSCPELQTASLDEFLDHLISDHGVCQSKLEMRSEILQQKIQWSLSLGPEELFQ